MRAQSKLKTQSEAPVAFPLYGGFWCLGIPCAVTRGSGNPRKAWAILRDLRRTRLMHQQSNEARHNSKCTAHPADP